MPFRIDHAHREALRTEAIATLAGLEEIHLAVEDGDTEFAARLSGRYVAIVRLLGAIGWEPRPTGPAFRIDMPAAVLGLAVDDLMRRAADRLASAGPRGPVRDAARADWHHCRAVRSVSAYLLREIGAEHGILRDPPPLAIGRVERELLRRATIFDLAQAGSIGDVAPQTHRDEPALLLRNRVEAQWRLLDDLGWQLADVRDSFELTIPEPELSIVLVRLCCRAATDLRTAPDSDCWRLGKAEQEERLVTLCVRLLREPTESDGLVLPATETSA